MSSAQQTVLVHKWQDANIGAAPFRVVAMISLPSKSMLEAGNIDGYNNALSFAIEDARQYGVGLGTCHVCGMGLTNNVIIRDKTGKHFVVGLDCAEKAGDTKVMTQAQNLERLRQKQIRDAKREAQALAERQVREAELQAQRERNGGLTDYELGQQQQAQAREQQQAHFSSINQWLIDVLQLQAQTYGCFNNFAANMINKLAESTLDSFSERQIAIIADIYAKSTSNARKGSKAYKSAINSFYLKAQINPPD